jgi:hypothetical protein
MAGGLRDRDTGLVRFSAREVWLGVLYAEFRCRTAGR